MSEPEHNKPKRRPAARHGVWACGGDYTDDEREILAAVEAWKKKNRRTFATIIDVKDIMETLGWRKGPTIIDAPRLGDD